MVVICCHLLTIEWSYVHQHEIESIECMMTIVRTRVVCKKLVGTSRENMYTPRLCPCREMISQGIIHAQNTSLVSCCTKSGWMISSWEPQEGLPTMIDVFYCRFDVVHGLTCQPL